MKHNRIPSLDGLRAISILLVMVGHLGAGHTVGAFGVQTFFVISGYLITTLLQTEHDRYGRIDLVAFYRRRSFRIFPAAYVFMGVVYLLGPAARPDMPYALTYTMSYHMAKSSQLMSHLWSLSVEEQFYLLWPVALVLGYRYRGRIAGCTMIAAALFRFGCSVVTPEQMPRLLHFCFPSVMDSIAAGCLLAVYEPEVCNVCSSLLRHSAFAITLPVASFMMAAFFWRNSFPGEPSNPHLTLLWGVIPISLAVFLLVAVERQDWLLNNPLASAIGVLSYSLYLWQQPFLVGTRNPVFSVAMVLLFAFLSYVLVEKPMLQLGARIRPAKAPEHVPA